MADARRKIEERTSVKLPPAKPDMCSATAEKGFEIKRGLPPKTAKIQTAGELPRDAVLFLVLHDEMAMQLGVQSIPTLILFKNGQAVERLVGSMPKDRLLSRILPHLPPESE